MASVTKLVVVENALRYLIAGYTVRETAVLCGVSYHTLLRYAREAEFRAQLKSLSADVWKRLEVELEASKQFVQSRVYEISDKALNRLAELVDGAKTENVALGAIKVALDLDDRHTTRGVEVKHIHMRAEDLQAAALAAQELEKA